MEWLGRANNVCDDFWVTELCRSETVSAKKKDTFIAARV